PLVAEPTHGDARRRHGKPRAKRGYTCDVVAMRPVRLAVAEHALLDLLRVDLWRLAEAVADAVRRQVVGPCDVEGPAVGLGQRRAAAADDDRFSHDRL